MNSVSATTAARTARTAYGSSTTPANTSGHGIETPSSTTLKSSLQATKPAHTACIAPCWRLCDSDVSRTRPHPRPPPRRHFLARRSRREHPADVLHHRPHLRPRQSHPLHGPRPLLVEPHRPHPPPHPRPPRSRSPRPLLRHRRPNPRPRQTPPPARGRHYTGWPILSSLIGKGGLLSS